MGTDWGPVVVAVVLFVVMSPGLLFQLPARTRVIEFGNMCTSGIAILVHAILYFCILTILVVAIGVHIVIWWVDEMKDWAAPIFAVALFALLSPGLLFQMPGKNQPVGILNMKTSIASILVHAVIYGLLLMLFLVILHLHLYV
ncbi:hypothetical protein Sjap_023269 [Stephania japonica]|uniref:Uncharacterized protein n=1 Tax=Stephania japonica TaxID=461633 RepID=A0AAP0EFY3_9MAGN